MKEKLVVLGAGESGIGAAILGKQKGYEVFLSDINTIPLSLQNLLDEKEIIWESGQHSLNLMKEASIAVKSPGISRDIPLLERLRGNGTRILSEIEFAAQATSATLIGITGTNGKSTTAKLLNLILINHKLDARLCGNIGNPVLLEKNISKKTIFVIRTIPKYNIR